MLLVKSSSLILNIGLSLVKELVVSLHLGQLLREFLVGVLLTLGLVLDTSDFRLNLLDLIFFSLDELLDDLESLISLLHTKEGLLPIIKKGLLGANNSLNLDGSLLEGVPGGSGLLLLGDELGLVQSLLLVKGFDLLIH